MTTVPDVLLEGIDRTRPLTGPMIRQAEAVYSALASSGIGDPWCLTDDRLPDAVRVGDRLIQLETDIDACGRPAGLGWLLTVFTVDGGEAQPVTVYVEDTKREACRRLVALLRQAVARPATARPMVWTRERPGLYRSGPYLVGQLTTTHEWFGEGPGVDQCFDSKADAQFACASALRGV